MYGDSIYTDGFSVYTTLDTRLQGDAETAVQKGLIAYDQRHGYRGPEANWGEPDLSRSKSFEQRLAAIPP